MKTRIMTLLIITAIFTFGPSAYAAKVVHWNFNQYTDPNVVIDSSGNGYHGIMVPGPNTVLADAFDGSVDRSGHTGESGDKALHFKKTWTSDPNTLIFHRVQALNVDPGVHMTNTSGPNIFLGTTPWTLNVWVKYEEFPGGSVNLAGFGDCEWDIEHAYIGPDDGTVILQKDRYLLTDGGGSASRRTGQFLSMAGNYGIGNVTDGQWHMLTLTWDPSYNPVSWCNGTLRSYLDGQFRRWSSCYSLDDVETSDYHFIINSGGLMSGAMGWDWDEFDNKFIIESSFYGVPFYGWIDDYSIFDETLAEDDIFKLYRTYTCMAEMPGDLNNDCKINLFDFQCLASDWLECPLVPASACP